MIETVLGTLLGGTFRLAPELLKWFDRKDERKHELSMFDKQLQADAARSTQRLSEIGAQAEASLNSAEMTALIEATKAQGVRTGVKWIDAVSSTVRPVLTYWWCLVLYTVALGAQFAVLVEGGASNVGAILTLWGPDEKAIVASIFAFWFVDRSLRKRR